ncbi:unnamed protein product [Anisakis simplex]|uniref:Restriction endonuclease subunit S n=1 Tax=Anisakis simplex TaxID=6269 RepID=A0A0M3JFI2_ANISI|nr:unnamed protein product [Anisakis simplex]
MEFRAKFVGLFRPNFARMPSLSFNCVLDASLQLLTDFKKWIATIRAQKSQLDARINALPPEARNALQQIESLRAKERQIIQSLNPLVANQLIGIL